MKKYLNLFVFAFLAILIVIFTNGFLNTYFQQDEWNGFGVIITLANKPIWAWFNLATSLHFFPLNSLTWLMMYRVFEYNAVYYILTAIIIHIIASFLVFILAKKLSSSMFVGVLTAVLFATNSRARTAFLHLGVFSNTVPFFIFVILFFIYLLNIAKKSVYGIKEAVILLLLFFSAVFFREEGVILIPLLPAFLYVYNKVALNKKNIKFFLVFYGFSTAFFIYRIYLQFITPHADQISGKSFFLTYLYNALTFPFKLIVQNIVDGYYDVMLFVIKHYNVIYPFEIPFQVVTTVLFDLAILLLFIIIAFLFIIFTKGIKDKVFWKHIQFFLFFILINAGMLATIGRRMERIEERYLYLSGFAVLFIFSLIAYKIYTTKTGNKLYNLGKKLFVSITIIIIIFSSYFVMQEEIKIHQLQGQVRKQIISNIVKLHPTIPKKTIFYIKCKEVCVRNVEFGVSNNLVLPFSSGPGWIILLQYAKENESAYHKFFSYNGQGIVWDWKVGKFAKTQVKEFLWDMGSQGYREIGDYGFGYYTDINLLQEVLLKEKLSKNVVIGLEYDEKKFIIKDVSKDIQNKL